MEDVISEFAILKQKLVSLTKTLNTMERYNKTYILNDKAIKKFKVNKKWFQTNLGDSVSIDQ